MTSTWRVASAFPLAPKSNAVSPFNHHVGICGADVTAPDETHHLCGHRGGHVRPAEVAWYRSNPREARRTSGGNGVDFPQGEGIFLGDGCTACLPRRSSMRSAPRGPFPRGLPRRLRLGLSRTCLPNITGLATDRSMGTLVPTGPTASPHAKPSNIPEYNPH